MLLLDLKKFFPSAPHATIYQRHQRLILDPSLRGLADSIVASSPCPTPGRGMPLGVEPSQQEMVALPSAVDNFIKCQAGVHVAGHYMDDYYIVLPDVEELKKLGREIVKRFEAIGVPVNKRKCKIIPLTKPFRFLQGPFYPHGERRHQDKRKPGRHEASPQKAQTVPQRGGCRNPAPSHTSSSTRKARAPIIGTLTTMDGSSGCGGWNMLYLEV